MVVGGGCCSKPSSWLLVFLLCCGYRVEGQSGECPARPYQASELSLRDRGGLSPLVASAESTRSVVIGGKLPYDYISTRAREAYTGLKPLTPSMFVGQWTSYTQNALFLSGFILFVGILLPGAAIALWTFWECCYEEDEEEDHENRNLTWQAQLVVWSLATALLAALLVLLVMIGILLGANSWMTEGVTRSSSVVRHTIPQLEELRDSSLDRLHHILVKSYDNLTFDLETAILGEIPLNVSRTVSELHQSTAISLNTSVGGYLSRRPHLLGLTVSMTNKLTSLHQLSTTLVLSLYQLRNSCSLIIANGNVEEEEDESLLTDACRNFTRDFSSLVPLFNFNEVGGVSETAYGTWQLEELRSKLNDSIFYEPVQYYPGNVFEDYLEELSRNLSTEVGSSGESYLSSLGTSLSEFTDNVTQFYNTALPLHSQHRVDFYLGPRHLSNWEWFRSALTITFAVLIFGGSIPLLVALFRGLYFVTAIYRYSETPSYNHGAHQAGMIIKRIAFSLSVVCVLSAVFMGMSLSFAGVMGKACGNHDNFTELLEKVVDDANTWSNGINDDSRHYPLAAILLDLPNVPLTVEETLSACRSNLSLFHALQLQQRYDLENSIRLDPLDKEIFIEEMQKIQPRPVDLFHPTLQRQLNTLDIATSLPVQWAELTSIDSASIFPQEPNLQTMLEKILNATAAAAVSSTSGNVTEEEVEVADTARETISNFNNLVVNMKSSLNGIASEASMLSNSLAEALSLSPSSSLTQLSASITLHSRMKYNLQATLASVTINKKLENYLNSSITNISCDLGTCHHLAADYDKFSSAVCGDIVPGLDLYWISLIITLSLSLLLMLLALLLASRFVNPEMWKQNHKNLKFHLGSVLVRQGFTTVWDLTSLAIYTWWIVYLSRDGFVRDHFCSSCCLDCVWGFGVLFLCVSGLVGGALQTYQYFTIYMISKCKAMKYRRFWVDRRKAVNFYGQLVLVFVQDIPFLILVALSSSKLGFLSVPIFYSLSVTLLTILAHLIYFVRHRKNVSAYWTWLKLELSKLGLVKRTYTPNQDLSSAANGGGGVASGQSRRGGGSSMTGGNGHINSMRSPYESSGSDHSENSSQGTFQEHGFEFHPPRLSDIPEYPEGGLDAVGAAGRIGLQPRRPHLETPLNDDDESEMSEQNSQFQSRVRLDRDIELDNEAYLQRRRDAIDNFERGGVEVAPAHYRRRDIDASTISESYYCASRNSIEMQGYISSSVAPDTNSYYESSDCRDEDGDSIYSQARFKLPLPSFMGEVTVDV